jgi:hypothetical protein
MADNDKRPLKLVRSLTPLQDDLRLQQWGQKLVDELQKDWDAKHPNGVEGMRRRLDFTCRFGAFVSAPKGSRCRVGA